MTLKIDNYKPKFIEDSLPKIGLIALSTDYTIEKDFNKICFDLPMKLFVNRLPFENPMNQKNYLKMSNHLENIAKNILLVEYFLLYFLHLLLWFLKCIRMQLY